MTTVVSRGAEARAGALGARAERARDWLSDQLEAPFLRPFRSRRGRMGGPRGDPPVRDTPCASGQRQDRPRLAACDALRSGVHAVLAGPQRGVVCRDASGLRGPADARSVRRPDPRPRAPASRAARAIAAADVARGAVRQPRRRRLPGERGAGRAAGLHDVHVRRLRRSSVARRRSALVDMASSFERGGFANYVWYQCRLIVAAERLWNTQGVEALQALQAGEVDVAAEVDWNWP